jgi:hypothetical protein
MLIWRVASLVDGRLRQLGLLAYAGRRGCNGAFGDGLNRLYDLVVAAASA